ncbi:MAG: hypothetical protein E7576_03660, partial [Ruminococcaceae bacterium]|nr:hypothetical protein [Oscillospiraceae bacterium]
MQNQSTGGSSQGPQNPTPYPQGTPYTGPFPVPGQSPKKKKKTGLILLIVLLILCALSLGFCGLLLWADDYPDYVDTLPVNPETPEDVGVTLERLAAEIPALTPDEDEEGAYLYEAEGDIPVILSVCDDYARKAEIDVYPSEKDTPSVLAGVTGDTAYTAVLNDYSVYVYMTVGEKNVRAEVPRERITVREGSTSSPKSPETAVIRKAASVAASAVTAARVAEPYAKGRDDYNHNHAVYFMEAADCLIFYPAQLTEMKAFEDQSVIFTDKRSAASLSVKLEFNPYRNIDELISLMKNSPNNTVLAVGEDWMAAETKKDGTVTFSYTGFGSKYMVEAEFSYPEKYGFVFGELRELIRCRFIEGGKWKSESRPPRKTVRTEYGAPGYGIEDLFYESHNLHLALPDTLDEQAEEADALIFHDFTNGRSASVRFFEVEKGAEDNLFDVFTVVAEDGDATLGDDYIRWHNKYGVFVGTVYDGEAALLELEGEEAYRAYEAVYDELICAFVPVYYERQPLSQGAWENPGQKKNEQKPAEIPGGTPDSGKTAGGSKGNTKDSPIKETSDTAGGKVSVPVSAPPANAIDTVIRKQVAEIAAKESGLPAPSLSSSAEQADGGSDTGVPPQDPLIYRSEADRIAANSTVWDWDDLGPYSRDSLLDTLLIVLSYNGYYEWMAYDGSNDDLSDDIDELLDDIWLDFPEYFTWENAGSPAQDLFPYLCEALEMEVVPEYRARSETALPAPNWLADAWEDEDFNEDRLDWETIRFYLDGGLDLPPFETLLLPGVMPQPYDPDPAPTPAEPEKPTEVPAAEEPLEPEDPDEPYGGGRIVYSLEEYGIVFDEEAVRMIKEEIVRLYWDYVETVSAEVRDEGLFTVDEFYFREPPDQDRVGWIEEYCLGPYELLDEEGMILTLYGNGIWTVKEDGALIEWGLLIPDSSEYGDLWYSLDRDGNFVTLWQFDSSFYQFSKYGRAERPGDFDWDTTSSYLRGGEDDEDAVEVEEEDEDEILYSWEDLGISFDRGDVRETAEELDRYYRHYRDLTGDWGDDMYREYERYLFSGPPDPDHAGEFPEYLAGIYVLADEDLNPDPDVPRILMISENGIWAEAEDGADALSEYGLLIPAETGTDLWYSLDTEGNLVTFW